MDLVVCIIFLYLTQRIASNDVNLPNHLSQLINKLIKETENKSENKTSFELIEPGNTSKIIYVKEKSNPKVVWQVKYEDITDKRNEDELKKTHKFQDNIPRKKIKHDAYGNFMNSKDSDKKRIPSFEYMLEHMPEHTTLKDSSPANVEVTTEKEIGSYKYPKIFDEIPLDQNNIKDSENILNNLTKLISSKNSMDTLNIINLNKNYEDLLKEIQEIKILHQKGNLIDKIGTSYPLMTHGTAIRYAYPKPLLTNYPILPNVGSSSSKKFLLQMPIYRQRFANYVPALVKKSFLANYQKGSRSHIHHVIGYP
ncbi:uncharacterized protein LOC124535337 [Vanessa cardui]|uniref:uncharacterized protein LOC124535337 n=1 Tax=Vanessa cardui TaxID=171605 RepID=UPI001F133307|nr:uncharacterized protein LOC124535337 [Vanessa cardui]